MQKKIKKYAETHTIYSYLFFLDEGSLCLLALGHGHAGDHYPFFLFLLFILLLHWILCVKL